MPRPSILFATLFGLGFLDSAWGQNAPRITRSPAVPTPLVVRQESENIGLSTYFSSGSPATVRWFRDGVVVSEEANATSPSVLSIANASPANTGTYWAEVSNAGGTAQSELFTFVVRPGEAPYFAVGPVARGSPYTRVENATIAGDPPTEFQWLRDGVPVAGAATVYLEIDALAPGSYSLRVRNRWGETSSPPLVLPIPTTSGPIIVRQPASVLTLDVGSDYDLSVSTNSPGAAYQWFRDGTLIAGETRDTLAFKPYDPSKAGRYHVVLTAAGATTRSSDSIVRTHAGHEIPHAAILPGRNVARGAGESLTLYGMPFGIATAAPVPAVGTGFPAPRFQWFRDGAPIAGATTQRLFVPRLGPADAGSYVFAAIDAQSRRAESPATTVTVAGARPPQAPFVLARSDTNSASVTFDAGRSIGFGAEVVSELPVSYEWFRDGTLLPQFTGPQLQIVDAHASDGGYYVLVARNAAGAVQAYAQRIEIRDDGSPRLLEQPPNKVLILPGNVFKPALRFSSSVTPRIIWRKDGNIIYNSFQNSGEFGVAYTPSSPGVYTATIEGRSAIGSPAVTTTPITVTLGAIDPGGIYRATEDPLFGRRSFVSNTGFAAYVRPDGTAVLISAGGGALPTYVFEDIRLDAAGLGNFNEPSPFAGGSPAPVTVRAGEGILSVREVASPTARHLGGTRVVSGVLLERAGRYAGRLANDSGPVQAIVAADGSVAIVATWGAANFAGYAQLQPGEIVSTRRSSDANAEWIEFGLDSSQARLSGLVRRSDGATRAFTLPQVEGPLRSRLGNLASRGYVGSAERTMISGLTLAGQGRLPILVRGVGPGLLQFGITSAIDRARLSVFSGATAVVENAGWSGAANNEFLVTTAARVGAFPLAAGSNDAAVFQELGLGSYTAQVVHPAGATGIGLIEVYDGSDGSGAARLSNLSVRGYVGGGQASMVAGVNVTGAVPRRLLIRGVGPGLATIGLSGVLADPFLRVYSGDHAVAENDDWPPTDELIRTSQQVGAFALAQRGRDAGLIVTLPPGSYSAVLTGNDGGTGVGLLEVYELP